MQMDLMFIGYVPVNVHSHYKTQHILWYREPVFIRDFHRLSYIRTW